MSSVIVMVSSADKGAKKMGLNPNAVVMWGITTIIGYFSTGTLDGALIGLGVGLGISLIAGFGNSYLR